MTYINDTKGSDKFTNKTDIERLHKVISGELKGRQQGHTYAKVHELAGAVGTGTLNTVICCIDRYNELNHIKPMIESIFKEMGLEISVNQYSNYDFRNIYSQNEHTEFECCDKRIKFILTHEFELKTMGMDNYYIVVF